MRRIKGATPRQHYDDCMSDLRCSFPKMHSEPYSVYLLHAGAERDRNYAIVVSIAFIYSLVIVCCSITVGTRGLAEGSFGDEWIDIVMLVVLVVSGMLMFAPIPFSRSAKRDTMKRWIKLAREGNIAEVCAMKVFFTGVELSESEDTCVHIGLRAIETDLALRILTAPPGATAEFLPVGLVGQP